MRACGSERKQGVRWEQRRTEPTRTEREREWSESSERSVIMCPECVASMANAAMITGLLSTGGLAVFLLNKLSIRFGGKKSFQKQNPKEESWVK